MDLGASTRCMAGRHHPSPRKQRRWCRRRRAPASRRASCTLRLACRAWRAHPQITQAPDRTHCWSAYAHAHKCCVFRPVQRVQRKLMALHTSTLHAIARASSPRLAILVTRGGLSFIVASGEASGKPARREPAPEPSPAVLAAVPPSPGALRHAHLRLRHNR